MGVGALVTIALSTLRTQSAWFPLHPIGYLAANSWGMHINWASFFLGWLLKVLVTRYGGLKLYNRLLPLFLGFLVGHLLRKSPLWTHAVSSMAFLVLLRIVFIRVRDNLERIEDERHALTRCERIEHDGRGDEERDLRAAADGNLDGERHLVSTGRRDRGIVVELSEFQS